MHLRPSDPRDEDLFMTMSSAVEQQPETSPTGGDLLDDVFGSDPSSPAFAADGVPASTAGTHPSDIPRLQQEHATAGYRDGITDAKAKSIQAGFDEGFGLGAAIGMRAGELLGILEGVATAVRSLAATDAAAAQAANILAEAKKELSTKAIFSADYWAGDGTWKYEVKTTAGEDDVVFADVASSHPLIYKWSETVEEQVRQWGIDRAILSVNEEQQQEADLKSTTAAVSPRPQSTEALEW